MLIIKYRKVFYTISAVVIAASIASFAFFGINPGIDFTGGTLVEVRYVGEMPGTATIQSALAEQGIMGVSVRASGSEGYSVRMRDITDEERMALSDTFSQDGAYEASIEQYSQVGPTIGAELRKKAFVAFAIVILAIVFFIAFAFRKVSRPVSSWVYGLIALVALAHDVLVPLGAFAAMAHFFGAQADTLFVTAILTILGYSVHDTIVVFDRVRENLRKQEGSRNMDFSLVAGQSLNQTFVRSVNTSLTTIIALGALFMLGPVATQDFALVLAVGIVAGTYSSIALATPLLVTAERILSKKA